MSAHKRPRGFTLVELFIAMAVLSLMIVGMMGLLVTFNTTTNQTVVTADLQDNARSSLEMLANDLRSGGMGGSNGTVGIAPGGSWAARVPTIYSGPEVEFQDPSSATSTGGAHAYKLRSIFIVGAEPATTGLNGAGDGVVAVITGPSDAKVRCTVVTGGAAVDKDCKASIVGATDLLEHAILLPDPNGGSGFWPLLVHDHQRASYISPTNVTGSEPGQQLQFAESASPAISPDPSAPFGFAQGFQVSRARVVHWYLSQPDKTKPPRLFRSRPVLTASTSGCPGVNPFVDNSIDSSSPVKGVDMGGGPIESLQFRFIFDPSGQDDPTKYEAVDNIDPCMADPTARMRQLREVRIQMVAISSTPAKDTSGGQAGVARFTTPTFEGVTVGSGKDKYPRRAFVTRVAPRNLQPYRL